MTDDDLERAIFDLPLALPPVDLRARILAATADRPRLTFRAWEIWAVGSLVAFIVWLSCFVATSVPDFSGTVAQAIGDGFDRLAGFVSPATLLWTAFGVSLGVWLPVFGLPASGGPKMAGR